MLLVKPKSVLFFANLNMLWMSLGVGLVCFLALRGFGADGWRFDFSVSFVFVLLILTFFALTLRGICLVYQKNNMIYTWEPWLLSPLKRRQFEPSQLCVTIVIEHPTIEAPRRQPTCELILKPRDELSSPVVLGRYEPWGVQGAHVLNPPSEALEHLTRVIETFKLSQC